MVRLQNIGSLFESYMPVFLEVDRLGSLNCKRPEFARRNCIQSNRSISFRDTNTVYASRANL